MFFGGRWRREGGRRKESELTFLRAQHRLLHALISPVRNPRQTSEVSKTSLIPYERFVLLKYPIDRSTPLNTRAHTPPPFLPALPDGHLPPHLPSALQLLLRSPLSSQRSPSLRSSRVWEDHACKGVGEGEWCGFREYSRRRRPRSFFSLSFGRSD